MKNNLHLIKGRFGKLLSLFILFAIYSSSGYTQISTKLIAFPDTSHLGSFDTAIVSIRNVGLSSYTGYINIYYSTDTIANTPVQFCSIPSVTLLPNDTVSTFCTIHFDSTYFNPGDNIVVVWSSGNARFAADTARDTVHIKPLIAGLHENGLNTSFTIFPSPAKDFIRINVSKNAPPLQQIKIMDVFGRTLYTKPFSNEEDQKINIQHLPQGLYFVELIYINEKRSVRKFIKSD